MNIRTVILNVLFITILICLIYFYIYLNNSNFEYFELENFYNPLAITDGNSSNNADTITSVEVSTPTQTGVGSIVPPQLVRTINNGKEFNVALSSIETADVIVRVAREEPGAFVPDYKDGYYWINLPFVGTRYIYCIMDKNYFRGGWMLAMRSVKGSKTFSYNSRHFSRETTLNDGSDYINSIIPKTSSGEADDVELSVSSIGNKIYNLADETGTLDAKFDTFNHFPAKEWMAIFYVKDDNHNPVIGGDISNPTINKRGWVWYEPNVKTTFNSSNTALDTEGISPLQLFNKFDTIPSARLDRDLTIHYNKYGYAQNIAGKFTNASSRTNQGALRGGLWSSQLMDGKSFYGLNYKNQSAGVAEGKSLVRWGFTFNDVKTDDTNDVVAGIGLSHGSDATGTNGYSAGNFENSNTMMSSSSKFWDKPKDESMRNMSYAVEWYVR
jgi:hypothetical protein